MSKREDKATRRKPAVRQADRTPDLVEPDRSWLMSAAAALKLLVFCAGAVLMGLEIAGSRILAPHFGNSVFVWGSLISVFLIALAAGYYLGGRLADRNPSQRLLNTICIAVSVWIFALAAIGHGMCESVEAGGFGLQFGPLLASALLFLPPSVGLGIVSPFSVRLAARSLQSVGSVSGALYALSTTGSILGTLLTTFVLIPVIGVTAILRLLGLAMLIVSLITLPRSKDSWERTVACIMLAMMAGGYFLPVSTTSPLQHGDIIQLDEDTPYHHVSVVDNPLNDTRELRFDQYIETGIRMKAPYPTLEAYTNHFHLAFLVRPKMERVLFIGAGGGVGPRAFLAHDAALLIEVVDIDNRVLEIAKQWFYLPDSPAIRLITEDGRMYLRHADGQYDCIVLDAFTIGGRIPFHLVTRECFELCRDRMTEHGVFVINLGSALDGPLSSIYRSLHRTLSAVFPNVYVFAVKNPAGRESATNIVLVAAKDSARIADAEWATRAADFQTASFVTAAELTEAAANLVVKQSPDPAAPILTDDYAPIETMPL